MSIKALRSGTGANIRTNNAVRHYVLTFIFIRPGINNYEEPTVPEHRLDGIDAG